jgi:hypothetical protein
MSCDEVKSRLGELLDGELSDELRPAVERHLDECRACRGEYESLRSMAAALARPPDAKLPVGLWEAIEQQLDAAPAVSMPATRPHTWRMRVYRLTRRPLAAAALVVLAIGLGWLLWSAPWTSTAMAAQIDFRPLLERADGDIEAGIHALIEAYGGEEISPAQAADRMRVRIQAGAELPGELRLESSYLLNMGGDHRALAFHYAGPAGHLLLLQCPPHIERNYGNYECLPCRVGSHDGHGVRVGQLHLMHMMSENVCVCVVSTLDEQSALPAALDAVRIDF